MTPITEWSTPLQTFFDILVWMATGNKARDISNRNSGLQNITIFRASELGVKVHGARRGHEKLQPPHVTFTRANDPATLISHVAKGLAP